MVTSRPRIREDVRVYFTPDACCPSGTHSTLHDGIEFATECCRTPISLHKGSRQKHKSDGAGGESSNPSSAEATRVDDKGTTDPLTQAGATEASQPHKSPVYLNYAEVFKGLKGQGFLGFFKGYGVGATVMAMRLWFSLHITTPLLLYDRGNISGRQVRAPLCSLV